MSRTKRYLDLMAEYDSDIDVVMEIMRGEQSGNTKRRDKEKVPDTGAKREGRKKHRS